MFLCHTNFCTQLQIAHCKYFGYTFGNGIVSVVFMIILYCLLAFECIECILFKYALANISCYFPSQLYDAHTEVNVCVTPSNEDEQPPFTGNMHLIY